MKVGVFTVILRSKPLEEVLDYLADLGVGAVEILDRLWHRGP